MHAAKNIILAMLVMTSFGCVQQREHIELPRGFDSAATKAHIPSNYANRDDKKINDQAIPSQLSLQKCIEISLRNNPDFSAVKYDVEAASARFEGAKSALWPKISVVGGYTHYNDKIRLVQAAYNGEPGLFTADIASEDIVLALPLFSGGKDWNNIKATDLLNLSAENKMAFSREELIFNVTSLYMSILAEEHVIRALEFSYAALEEQAKRITSLINEQKAANVDLLRAEVRLADVREKIILEKNVYATTRFNGNLHEQEEGLPQALERTGLVSGKNGSGKMVRQQQGRREECHSVGSNHQEATGGRSRDCAGKSDPFGLRAPTGDDS